MAGCRQTAPHSPIINILNITATCCKAEGGSLENRQLGVSASVTTSGLSHSELILIADYWTLGLSIYNRGVTQCSAGQFNASLCNPALCVVKQDRNVGKRRQQFIVSSLLESTCCINVAQPTAVQTSLLRLPADGHRRDAVRLLFRYDQQRLKDDMQWSFGCQSKLLVVYL